MPATAFNAVVEHLVNWKIARGQVEKVTFGAAVHDGVARGSLTPLYTGLSVDVTGHGSGGILGLHGIIGGAARGLASIVARSKLNGDNPDAPGKAPRIGPIRHTFTPSETLPGFLWVSVREGLLVVMVK
jgi:hypothetical protein